MFKDNSRLVAKEELRNHINFRYIEMHIFQEASDIYNPSGKFIIDIPCIIL